MRLRQFHFHEPLTTIVNKTKHVGSEPFSQSHLVSLSFASLEFCFASFLFCFVWKPHLKNEHISFCGYINITEVLFFMTFQWVKIRKIP
jgi:hypothetical protein